MSGAAKPRETSRGGARDPVDRQLALRAATAGLSVAVGSLPVLLLLLWVETKWTPLLELDDGARDGLHRFALGHQAFTSVMEFVSAVAGGLGWQVVSVVLVAWLLWRRRVRVAVFVLVANAGSSLLNTAIKDVVHRHRPVVSHPFIHPPGQSFPSGHAQAAATGFTVLLFVLWPYLGTGWRRRLAVGVAVLLTLLIGFSRVALAAHFVSDVVAGYAVGLTWTLVLAAAFHVWRKPGARSHR